MAYPLDELDDLEYKGKNEKEDGAFEIIINNSHFDLLGNKLIVQLVDKKWKSFAERILWDRFVWFCVYLAVLFAFSMERPLVQVTPIIVADTSEAEVIHASKNVGLLLLYGLSVCLAAREVQTLASIGFSSYVWSNGLSRQGRILACCFVSYVSVLGYLDFFCRPESEASIFHGLLVLLLGGSFWKAHRELQEIVSSGWTSYFSATGSALLENLLSLVHALCIGLFTLLHFLESPLASYALAVSSFICILYSFIFLLAIEFTGPMVVMLYGVMKGDVIRFFIVCTIFVLACTKAIFVFETDRGWTGFCNAVIFCFDAATNVDIRKASFMQGTALLSITVILQILLMNLLIAMIGDTYSNTKEDCQRHWEMERARIVFAVENEMSVSERKDAKNMYFTKIRGKMYLQARRMMLMSLDNVSVLCCPLIVV